MPDEGITPPNQPDYSRKWWVMLSVAMGTFLGTIDGSIMNVALPTLKKALDTDLAMVQWAIISYTLIVTSLILGVGRLADMIGKKRIYLTGMTVFVFGSILCGLAPNIHFLIGFRVLQGIGAVMLQALGMAIVTEAFPRSERGRALGLMGTVVSLGISLGPTAGGILIGTVGWRAIFLVNVPVGAAGLFLGRRFIPDWRPPGGQRFDALGAVIMLLALVALALGLTFGPENNWDSLSLALLIGAGVGLLVFVLVEKRLPHPMIDLHLFRDPLFSISLLTALLVFVVNAGMLLLPFYLETVRGLSTELTGLALTVVPAALGLMAPIAGALSDRYGSRGISLAGLVVVIGGCLSIATLRENTSTFGYIIRLLPLGLGIGLFQSPNNSAIMGTASREQLGVVSGLLALSRNMGNVVGVPLMTAIFSSRVVAVAHLSRGADVTNAPHGALVDGLQTSFHIAAGVITLGTLFALVAFTLERRRIRDAKTVEVTA